MKRLITILYLLTLTILASGENAFKDIKITSHNVGKDGNELRVDMTINLNDLELKAQEAVVITPILYSEDKSHSISLSPVTVSGKTRMKAYRREEALGNENVLTNAIATLKRKNNSEQSIAYSTRVPFEKWMYDGSIELMFEQDGCQLCGDRQHPRQQNLLDDCIVPRFVPAYLTSGIAEPMPEIKRTDIKGSASIRFRVNKYNIDENYLGNKDEIKAIKESIQTVIDNEDFTIDSIGISGYASIEGPYDYNIRLSEKRAKSLSGYLQKYFENIDTSNWTIMWYGEDWEGTLRAMEEKAETYGADIIEVMADTVTEPNARERLLIRTAGQNLYNKMLREEFPSIRRIDYTIGYVIRPFDMKEATERISTNPELLSANEMHKVASQYDRNSEEYREILVLSARSNKGNPQAVINAAIACMEAGELETAADIINSYDGPYNTDIVNVHGVILARSGKLESAKECFESIAADNEDAAENLRQIMIVIEQR